MNYQNYVETLKLMKKHGVSKEEALDCLEFDSDEYPNYDELKKALEEAFK